MTEDYPCSVCGKQVISDAIFCNSCDSWVHFQCNHLSKSDFDSLVKSDESEPWSCIKCNFDALNHVDNSCEFYDVPSFNSKNLNDKNLSFLHLNISSSDKHFDNFDTFLKSLNHTFKIIGISETRIRSGNTDFPLQDYKAFHTPTEAEAGGTSLYIQESLKPSRRQDLESFLYVPKTLESTFGEFSQGSSNFVVGTIYKHPFMKVLDFIPLLGPVLDKVSSEGKALILLGDFNINLLNFDKDPNVFKFLDTLGSYLLKPYINIPTRISDHSETVIDNIFISSVPFSACSGNFITGISDHLIQFTVLDNANSSTLPETLFYKDWKNFNSIRFSEEFESTDWPTILAPEKLNPELSFISFYDKINHMINENLPLKLITKKQKKRDLKPWITKGILKSMSIRDKLLKKFIKAKNQDSKTLLHSKYKSYRNRITDLLRVSKKLHYQNFFNLNSKNPKRTWEGINEIINKNTRKTASTIILNVNNKTVTDPSSISDEFNLFFTTVAEKIQSEIPKVGNFENYINRLESPESFFFSPVTKPEIIKVIHSLDQSKSTGDFSIPKQVFNSVPDKLAEILEILINLTFETGIFPSSLKKVKVIPVFKNKGSNQDVTNYRPISLLSNVDKIFEKLVYSRLISYLERHNILSDRQFGFRKKHSTKLALISLTEEIRRYLDSGQFACGVFIDLQKAFDTVDHDILLRKLELYGVRGIANKWFRSYLSNRIQYVSYLNSKSTCKNISVGVPQGSVLGPLLFLIYINDLCNALQFSKTSLFADDTSIIYSDLCLQNIEDRINLDLDNLFIWLCANKISLNITKTKILLFRNVHKILNHNLEFKINSQPIYLSQSVKYLGVTLDHFMNWSLYTKSLCSKLNSANGAISRLRHYVPRTTLIQIYYALFFSHLNYACQVWGQTTNPNIQRVFILQKKCLRLMTFSDFNAPSSQLFSNLGLLKFSDLVKVRNVSLIHQILTNQCPTRVSSIFSLSYYHHGHHTRGNNINLLSRPLCRTLAYGVNSITYQSILHWNELQQIHHDMILTELSKRRLYHIHSNLMLNQY